MEGCPDTVVAAGDVMGRCIVMNYKDFLACEFDFSLFYFTVVCNGSGWLFAVRS